MMLLTLWKCLGLDPVRPLEQSLTDVNPPAITLLVGRRTQFIILFIISRHVGEIQAQRWQLLLIAGFAAGPQCSPWILISAPDITPGGMRLPPFPFCR